MSELWRSAELLDGGGDDDDGEEEHFPARSASWELLEARVREFAAHAFQAFRVRSTVSVRARNAALERRSSSSRPPSVRAERQNQKSTQKPTPRLPDAWRFYSKTYTCTHGLSYTPSERRRQKPAPLVVRASGCTARINASVTFDRAARVFYVRSVVRGQHNHPVGRAQYYSYVEHRRILDPALLALISEREACGERTQTIFDTVAKHVEDTTGAECVFQLQDVRNVVLRLQREKRKKRARLPPPSPSLSSVSSPGAAGARGESSFGYETLLRGERGTDLGAADPGSDAASDAGSDDYHDDDDDNDDGDDDEVDEEDERDEDIEGESAETPQHRANKRPLRMIGSSSELAVAAPRERVKLSRLEVLLDSGFCFALSHQYVDRMDVAVVEAIPGGVTRFQHSVVAIPPGSQVQDVDFVLPQYVTDGCEKSIVDACHRQQRMPSAVGVSLSVQRRDSRQSPSFSVVLTARQVKVMKLYYNARELMRQVRSATDWVNATSFGTRPACAPFDDCFDRPKELFTYPLSTMALAKTNVSGASRSLSGVTQFADSIYAPNILKLLGGGDVGPDITAENIDGDCVKAVLLHMHARFCASISFVCPTFVGEGDAGERRRVAALYGAFATPKPFTAGVVQLPSSLRWGGFFFDSSAKVCCVYTSRESEYDELRALVRGLWQSFGAEVVAFEVFPASTMANSTSSPTVGGILALCFVELMLHGKSWADASVDSIEYLRCRYMLQAIQVVNKQDVHLIP